MADDIALHHVNHIPGNVGSMVGDSFYEPRHGELMRQGFYDPSAA